MSGYTSDQLVAHATADAQMVPLGQRARITGIQAEGAASSSIVFKSGGAGGTVLATFTTQSLALLTKLSYKLRTIH